MKAKCGNFDSQALGGVDKRAAFGHLYFVIVYYNRSQVFFSHGHTFFMASNVQTSKQIPHFVHFSCWMMWISFRFPLIAE